MNFNATERKLIENIVEAEDLDVRFSGNYENAIGDTVFRVTGKKEEMMILREVYNMVA